MIYIVVRDVGWYSDREVFNEAVFDDKQKAVEYVLSKGYEHRDELKGYMKLDDKGKLDESDLYFIEEWKVNTVKDDDGNYY